MILLETTLGGEFNMVLLQKKEKTCGLFNLVVICVVYLVWINELQPESISKFFGSVGDQTL